GLFLSVRYSPSPPSKQLYSLKFETGFARSVRQGLDTSVVHPAVAVEAYALDRCGLCLGAQFGTNFLRRFNVSAGDLQLLRRRGAKRAARLIVDDLGIDVIQ